MKKNNKDFSNQRIHEYIEPTKDLHECKETIKLLLEEREKNNPYRSLARMFELYKQGAKEEHSDYYFYKYLESLEIKNQYTFLVGNKKIDVPIDILNPYVEINDDENNLIKVVHPQWHLIISYYAYIDAMYNHADNEHASKIRDMPGCPSGRFGIRCKSLKKWLEEAF